MSSSDLDVIIVGYGPVAEVLAVTLGRQGRKVAVLERWSERYSLPRAVCIDHELYRVLCAIGMRDALPAVSHTAPPYRWYNADWKELLAIDWSVESISGGPEVNFVHQPTMEAMFDEQARCQPTVDIHLGWEAVEVSQDEDRAHLVAVNTTTGERRTWSAQYVVGCDGANSLVRKAIGGDQEDRGFEADWLVIDILPNEGVELNIPPAAQWCNPERPTTIVPAGIRDGRYYRRWEFMRLPGESIEAMEHEETAWRWLAPWVRPDQATIIRHKVYSFRSLLAESWRDRRLLIAGDAAHVMPPFMGQGMCAGLRDDWNLAWKLALVLDGKASPALLDSYQTERSPHVSDIIDISMYLGRIICQPDPVKCAERDEMFLSGKAPPPPSFPQLTGGLIDRNAPAAGLVSPHGQIARGGAEGRFDDLVGAGCFVVIAQDTVVLDSLSQRSRRELDVLAARIVALEGPAGDERVVADLSGKYRDFLAQHGARAMLVRPDFYIYGAAAEPAGLEGLIASLTTALGLTTVKQNVGAE